MQTRLIRQATLPRRGQILDGLDLDRLVGAEIGALDKPLVERNDGQVFYVDHCDTESLKARWSSDPAVNVEKLHVDAVWGQKSLREALDSAQAFATRQTGLDYVVASHVIEHVPDLVSWLREIRASLAPEGSVRLAVPDRRFTFDYLRQTSTLTDVLDAFVRKRRTPSGSRVLDFALHLADVDCAAAWRGEVTRDNVVPKYTVDTAIGLADDAEQNGTYHDVHCWVFTPTSFAELMLSLGECGHLEFRCDWLVPTALNTFEFFVSIKPERDHKSVADSWRAVVGLLREQGQ